MDTNAQIISDLQNKIGFNQSLDFLSDWKGVPVMVTGYIQEVQKEKLVFRNIAPLLQNNSMIKTGEINHKN